MARMAQLITGDAVTLDLRIAGLPSRTLALAVDVALQVLLLFLGMTLVSWVFSAGGSSGAQAALTLTAVVFALVVWPTLIETVTRGRSLGKAMMGLRVVRDDGGAIRMRHSLVRALAMVFLDLWVTSGVVGAISALASARSKRMGDHLAGTIVVGERIPRSATAHDQPILMPLPLAAWAAGLDLVAVPDGLALNARTFLHRAASLDPRARESTSARLATELAGFVRTPAPLGTPAEAYIAAVLAERTRRSQANGVAGGWGSPGAEQASWTPPPAVAAPVPPAVLPSGVPPAAGPLPAIARPAIPPPAVPPAPPPAAPPPTAPAPPTLPAAGTTPAPPPAAPPPPGTGFALPQ